MKKILLGKYKAYILGIIVILIIDYFDLPSRIGVKITNFNLDFINLMVIVLAFIFTYSLIDSKQIKKEKNKTEVFILIMLNSYKDCISNINMMTDEIINKFILPNFDFDKSKFENDMLCNLEKSPFKDEDMLYSLLGEGQIDINKYKRYLDIKSGYVDYFNRRIIFFDHPELYEPLKEDLLGIINNEINNLEKISNKF